jgi:hypothetical protein
LVFQAFIDKSPSTVLLIINLALTIIGATTRTIYQTLMAGSDWADASGFTEDTVTTLCTNLMKIARGIFYSNEQGIQCWDNWVVNIQAHSVHPQGTGHCQNTARILNRSTIFFHCYLGHFVASSGDNHPATNPFIYLLKVALHLYNLVNSAGLGHGSARTATNNKQSVKVG